MDIHNSIMDIHNLIMNIHNLIMDIHNSIMDIHNYGVYALLAFHNSDTRSHRRGREVGGGHDHHCDVTNHAHFSCWIFSALLHEASSMTPQEKWFPCLTTPLLSIEHADWSKLHDMFKIRDAKTWQRKFPVGFPVRVCALNLLFINISHDFVVRIESRCMIEAKHV